MICKKIRGEGFSAWNWLIEFSSALPGTVLISFPSPQLLDCKRKRSTLHVKRDFGNNKVCK